MTLVEQLSKALAYSAPAYFALVLMNVNEDDPQFDALKSIGREMAECMPDDSLSVYESLMLVKSAFDAAKEQP